MSWHKEHINEVAKRWQEKYENSGLTLAAFKKAAAKILKSYGWNEREVEQILSKIN